MRHAALPSAPPPQRTSLESLCIDGSEAIYCLTSQTLADVVAMFRANEHIRLLPVVDHAMRPVGAIHENDVRRILFNPYGHALLSNPSFRTDLDTLLRDCPVGEAGSDIGQLLDIYARREGSLGMILTRHGRYWGTVSNRTLLALASLREAARQSAMTGVASRFQAEASMLSEMLRSASDTLAQTAAVTARRAETNREDCNAAATAAAQVSSSMEMLAGESDLLASALDQLRTGVSETRSAAREAVSIVAEERGRTQRFARTADVMADTLQVIRQLAQSINHLAFNARIEATRAGASGSGFVVVAQEIKQFADRARAAASDVATRLDEVRSTVDAAATGHRGMERVIHSVEDMCRSVESAIEDHRALGQRLATDAREAADAAQSITRSIGTMHQRSAEAAASAAELRDLSANLATNSANLHGQILDYVNEMRAA